MNSSLSCSSHRRRRSSRSWNCGLGVYGRSIFGDIARNVGWVRVNPAVLLILVLRVSTRSVTEELLLAQ
jgi:hypothetical protein